MRRAIALTTLVVLTFALAGVAGATESTCKDLGFDNLEASTSGEWGSITFDNTEPTLALVVSEGYEVRLCIKAGSAQQGDGPELTEWFSEGEYSVGHSTGKDLSHFGYEVRETGTTTTTEATTTTTQATTTTTQPSTTTTDPFDNRVRWSARSECDAVSVDFVGRIERVDVFIGSDLVWTFEEPGTIRTTKNDRTDVRLVARPQEGYHPTPASITLEVGGCPTATTVPPTTIAEVPTTTPSPTTRLEELPFTGAEDYAVAAVMALAALIGGTYLVRRGRTDAE